MDQRDDRRDSGDELVTTYRAAGDATLAFIAAGPLEDLMTQHGEQFIDRIELEAGREPKVRRALCGVWGRDRMASAVAQRVDRLVANQPPL